MRTTLEHVWSISYSTVLLNGRTLNDFHGLFVIAAQEDSISRWVYRHRARPVYLLPEESSVDLGRSHSFFPRCWLTTRILNVYGTKSLQHWKRRFLMKMSFGFLFSVFCFLFSVFCFLFLFAFSFVSHFSHRSFFPVCSNQSTLNQEQQYFTLVKFRNHEGKHSAQWTAHPQAGTLTSASCMKMHQIQFSVIMNLIPLKPMKWIRNHWNTENR
jgi:hypothetical protein